MKYKVVRFSDSNLLEDQLNKWTEDHPDYRLISVSPEFAVEWTQYMAVFEWRGKFDELGVSYYPVQDSE